MIASGREPHIRDTVLGGLVKLHILGDVASGVGLTRCRSGGTTTEERHRGGRESARESSVLGVKESERWEVDEGEKKATSQGGTEYPHK